MLVISEFVVLTIVLSLSTPSTPAAITTDDVPSRVAQLEYDFAALQSQIQAQEQDHAAIFTSILSTLLANKNDLAALEAHVNASMSAVTSKLAALKGNVNASLTATNAIVADIETWINNSIVSNKNELSLVKAKMNTSISSCDKDMENMTNELNSTISSSRHLITTTKTQLNARITSSVHKLTAGQSKLNDTVMDNQVHIESIQAQQRSTELSLRQLEVLYQGLRQKGDILVGRELTHKRLSVDMNENVAFEVVQFLHSGVVEFSNVTFNTGEGYDLKSGIFMAPVSGTYLLWARAGENIRTIKIMVNGKAAGIIYGTVCQPIDQDPIRHTADTMNGVLITSADTMNGVLITSLRMNDHVTFRFSPTDGQDWPCTIGGVLIHRHFQ